MRRRLIGTGMVILGAIVGLLPFASWYRVDLQGRDVFASGIDVRGELWTLPVLACVIVAVGLATVGSTHAAGVLAVRWLGGICAVAGTLSLGWALWSVWRVTAVAVPVDLGDGPAASLRAEPVALLAAAAASGVAALSLWWVRSTGG